MVEENLAGGEVHGCRRFGKFHTVVPGEIGISTIFGDELRGLTVHREDRGQVKRSF